MVSFEELVELSVMETLSKVLGQAVWKAISFYFDPKALFRDPDALPGILGGLFGGNANVLEKVIAKDLLVRVGVPEDKRKGSDFRTFIRVAKAKFTSSTSSVGESGPVAL